MTPYLAFYATIASLLLFANKVVKRQAKYILLVVFLMLALFSGLRGIVGSDTREYLRIYNQLSNADGIMSAIAVMEPGFIALLALHKEIFNSETLFILMMSASQVFLLYAASKNSSKKYIFILCYVLLFYLNFHFNIIRSAIATMLFLYGITGKSTSTRRAALILAPLFHLTILPFYLVFLDQLKLKQILGALALLMVLITINFETILIYTARYLQYATYGGWLSSEVSLYSIFISVFAIASLFYLKNTNYMFRWMSGFLILFHVITYFYPIAFRFTITAAVFYYYYLIEELANNNRIVPKLFLWMPLILSFYVVITGISNESINLVKRINSGELVIDALESTYIPYKFSWNDHRIRN